MKKVDVIYTGWEENWILGQLAQSGSKLFFEYSAEALKRGIEFSPLHLKLKPEAYSRFPSYQQQLPGLIYDSLPDGWGLLLMDKFFRKQGLNLQEISPLDRLSFLGNRAIGALEFKPAQEQLLNKHNLSILKIANEVQKIINDKASDILPLLAQMGGSPQGARPKVLIEYNEKTKNISSKQSPDFEPWLIKFPAQNEHYELCAIEALYMQLAKKAGLPATTTDYFELGPKLAAFGIKRFDRDKQIKIMSHTLAGMLHVDFRQASAVDYVTFLRTVRLLTRDEQQVLRAFRQCVFNVIFNNRDDHPKNITFLMNKKYQWQQSPVYDLTYSYGPGGEHHMDICGEGLMPKRSDLINLSEKAGLNLTKSNQVITEVSHVANQFKTYAKNWPIRKKTVDMIQLIIQKHLKNML